MWSYLSESTTLSLEHRRCLKPVSTTATCARNGGQIKRSKQIAYSPCNYIILFGYQPVDLRTQTCSHQNSWCLMFVQLISVAISRVNTMDFTGFNPSLYQTIKQVQQHHLGSLKENMYMCNYPMITVLWSVFTVICRTSSSSAHLHCSSLSNP